MKILSLDTSAKTATAALTEDDRLLAEYSLHTDQHSTVLLPMIESLLELARLTVKDVDLFAVSDGPGSFTGIRIGVSTVKGLAFADRTPCVGVSALEAMAYNLAGMEGLAVPVIDARRGLVYTAVFRCLPDGSVERLTEDCQISVPELFALLEAYPSETVRFTGDAYDRVVSDPARPERTAVTPEKLRGQSAYGAAAAALAKWNRTEDRSVFTDAALTPVYLKKSQAEREREERLAAEAN